MLLSALKGNSIFEKLLKNIYSSVEIQRSYLPDFFARKSAHTAPSKKTAKAGWLGDKKYEVYLQDRMWRTITLIWKIQV